MRLRLARFPYLSYWQEVNSKNRANSRNLLSVIASSIDSDMIQPCKIRVSNILLILNPMRARFAKPCKDAKIFVMLAKIFGFTKNFSFAKVSTYSEEIGFSGSHIEQQICEFGGSTKLISTGRRRGEFSGRCICFFRFFPQPMHNIYPRSARIFGAVQQFPFWCNAEFLPHTA